MDRHPAAYLRRSFVDADSPGDISREAQRAAVRKLAAADGHNGNLVTYSDWNVSADVAKSAARTEYARLLEDMEAGRIVAVYAFDTDRIYRDVRDLIRLQDAARRHNVTITTKAGRLPIGDSDDPAGEGFAFITAVFGRMELQKSKKRSAAAMEARRARGDKLGRAAFGYVLARDDKGRVVEIPGPDHALVAVVVDAYRTTHSVTKASKLLQRQGIPAPLGGARWGLHTVTSIIEKNAPGLFPRPSRIAGRRTPTTAWYAQLCVCHCGATMSPNQARHQAYCPWGHRTGADVHGRTTISENAIRAYVVAELEHFQLETDTYETEAHNVARRAAINARLDRHREAWLSQDPLEKIDRKRWEAEKARARADLDALDSTEIIRIELPDPDLLWTYAQPDIAKILRSIFLRIDLSADMVPSATWRNRAMRRPD